MGYSHILIHYSEIALKGKNRPKFIQHLAQNIRIAFKKLPLLKITTPSGRILLEAQKEKFFTKDAFKHLSQIYGISSYAGIICTDLNFDSIKKAASNLMQDQKYESFRVSARRAFKNLALSSTDVNQKLGAYILENFGGTVKMKGADIEIFVEMIPRYAYIYIEHIDGLGGLPVGVSGKVATLLSGGIDSPVAASKMMQRGCQTSFIHFHSHPMVSKASLEKAEDLVHHLNHYQAKTTLYTVPFANLQRIIITDAKEHLRVILYRRFMIRIAEILAKKDGAKALVSGESLAQVASQTLTNLLVTDEASQMMILRPLIGMDKNEIILSAKKLGTYDISILPDEDCCSLFIPKHPETHAKLEEVKYIESQLNTEDTFQNTLDNVEKIPFSKI